MVKTVMEQHDGGVDVETDPGNGTEVTLWLPLASASTEATP